MTSSGTFSPHVLTRALSPLVEAATRLAGHPLRTRSMAPNWCLLPKLPKTAVNQDGRLTTHTPMKVRLASALALSLSTMQCVD